MEAINQIRRQNRPVVTPVRPPAVRTSPGGAVHSLSRAGFKVGRRPSTKGVDFSTLRRYDGPPLTQSTMREAFRRQELSTICEDEVGGREDEDGDELNGLAEENFPALDGRRSTRRRLGDSDSSSSSSSSSSTSNGIGDNGSGSYSDTRLVRVSVSRDIPVASGSGREVDSSSHVSASSSSVGEF